MIYQQARHIVEHIGATNPKATWEYMTGSKWREWFTPRQGEVSPHDGLTDTERFAIRVGREWSRQAFQLYKELGLGKKSTSGLRKQQRQQNTRTAQVQSNTGTLQIVR